jgi:hypothetical protein
MFALASILLLCAAGFAKVASTLRHASDIAPLPENRVLHTSHKDGEIYKLVDDGHVYRVIEPGKRWAYIDTVFNPEAIRKSYVADGRTIYRVDEGTGKRYRVLQQFQENFEGVPLGVEGLRALIGETRKWTEVTLQSPLAPTVPDYVALRQKILQGKGDFLGSQVEPSRDQAHVGGQSLKCVCPAKSSAMECSKASLSTGFIYFVKGDDVWYRAWYRIDGKTRPHTLVDLEDSMVTGSPGIRVMVFEEGYLGVELKSLEKPTYRQASRKRTLFPTDRWVEVVWHVHLDDGPAGRVQLWQGGALLVDAAGQTLPFRTAIYNSLEVGISAHSFGDKPATLYVDDLIVTTKPLRKD